MNINQKIVLALDVLSSSSSSDDEEMYVEISKKMKVNVPTVSNFITTVVTNFTNKLFKENFRVERKTAYQLIEMFQSSLHYPKQENALSTVKSAETHILSFLWFASNKVCLRDVSQRFGVGRTTLFRMNDRVMDFFISIASKVIAFPLTEDAKSIMAKEFEQVSGFPNVLGCIDGTSISIRTPAHKIKSTYVNRHDIPALTLQGICNSRKMFTDIFTGISAKVHDSRVLNLSQTIPSVTTDLPQICGSQYHILGDSAYPIREWLLTPFRDYGSLTNSEKSFNKQFCATRVLIENTFGILKGRFRQLLQVDMQKVSKITRFIVSCCVIHNLCIENNDHLEEEAVMVLNEKDVILSRDNEATLKRKGEIKRLTIKDTLQN